mmetsp:Transcript_142537/g.318894  ORF Transcript_142537/g.318894 Transcript_142537/m.318894 type:complete len:213 (-) Transcript_142537:4-642(-)
MLLGRKDIGATAWTGPITRTSTGRRGHYNTIGPRISTFEAGRLGREDRGFTARAHPIPSFDTSSAPDKRDTTRRLLVVACEAFYLGGEDIDFALWTNPIPRPLTWHRHYRRSDHKLRGRVPLCCLRRSLVVVRTTVLVQKLHPRPDDATTRRRRRRYSRLPGRCHRKSGPFLVVFTTSPLREAGHILEPLGRRPRRHGGWPLRRVTKIPPGG